MQAGKPVDDVCYDCGRTAKSVFYHSGLAHTGEAFSHSQCYIPSNIQSSEERTSRFADHPAFNLAGFEHNVVTEFNATVFSVGVGGLKNKGYSFNKYSFNTIE